jgi:uncharacterized lipoprotein YmbA
MRTRLVTAIMLASAIFAGCATQKADFYTLSPAAPHEGGRPATSVSVSVGWVSVPELVDRPQIVVDSGANRVDINEFARWAEPLKSQIPRVVAADLAQELNSTRVSASPAIADPATVYRVRIDIQRFSATLGESATLDALWSVVPPGAGAPLTGRTTLSEPCAGGGYDALVAAYSRTLAALSHDIAARIGPRPAQAPE